MERMDPELKREQERIDRLKQAMYSRALSEKLKARERRELSGEREVVGEEWMRSEPQLSPTNVAPRGVGAGRFALYAILVAAVLFFLGAVGFFGYFFFIGGGAQLYMGMNSIQRKKTARFPASVGTMPGTFSAK